jgi:hypothetical protein
MAMGAQVACDLAAMMRRVHDNVSKNVFDRAGPSFPFAVLVCNLLGKQ